MELSMEQRYNLERAKKYHMNYVLAGVIGKPVCSAVVVILLSLFQNRGDISSGWYFLGAVLLFAPDFLISMGISGFVRENIYFTFAYALTLVSMGFTFLNVYLQVIAHVNLSATLSILGGITLVGVIYLCRAGYQRTLKENAYYTGQSPMDMLLYLQAGMTAVYLLQFFGTVGPNAVFGPFNIVSSVFQIGLMVLMVRSLLQIHTEVNSFEFLVSCKHQFVLNGIVGLVSMVLGCFLFYSIQ